MEASATGSWSGDFEGGRRQSRRRNKIGGLWQRQLDGETGGGNAWKLKPLEAAAEVLKRPGGSLGGATKQEHRSEAFGRGSWTERRHPLEAAAEVLKGTGGSLRRNKAGAQIGGLWQSQLDGETGRGTAWKLRATGSCSEGFEGGRWQSRRRNKAGAQIGGLWQGVERRMGAVGDGFRLLTGPSGSLGTEWVLQGAAERGT